MTPNQAIAEHFRMTAQNALDMHHKLEKAGSGCTAEFIGLLRAEFVAAHYAGKVLFSSQTVG